MNRLQVFVKHPGVVAYEVQPVEFEALNLPHIICGTCSGGTMPASIHFRCVVDFGCHLICTPPRPQMPSGDAPGEVPTRDVQDEAMAVGRGSCRRGDPVSCAGRGWAPAPVPSRSHLVWNTESSTCPVRRSGYELHAVSFKRSAGLLRLSSQQPQPRGRV